MHSTTTEATFFIYFKLHLNKVILTQLLTSDARFVLWKAHVYVTDTFLVTLCENDCLLLLPSQDSTTVVLLLLTSCRGHHNYSELGTRCNYCD